jgi:hypothetical protein
MILDVGFFFWCHILQLIFVRTATSFFHTVVQMQSDRVVYKDEKKEDNSPECVEDGINRQISPCFPPSRFSLAIGQIPSHQSQPKESVK